MTISKNCIHCKRCTKNCSFLKKYDMDLSEFENRPDLAYNCFMCGKCNIVCPKDIDGRLISMKHKENEISNNNNKIKQKDYKLLIAEKRHYLFKNYKNVDNKKSCLFTGCNFLSYTPNTADKLLEICNNNDIGIIFDCCGKPLYDLGLKEDAKKMIDGIEKKLKKMGVEEIITACPNCYHFFKDKIDVNVVDVYSKLGSMNLLNQISGEYDVFRPCSDRATNEILNSIQKYNPDLKINLMNEQCCGAGGCADSKEPELAYKMREDAILESDNILAYCSTCTGYIHNQNGNIQHFLTKMLGVEEDFSTNSLMNRMKYRFYTKKL